MEHIVVENPIIRLNTPPKERQGADRSATNCTCPDIFGISQTFANELGLAPKMAGTLVDLVLSEVIEAPTQTTRTEPLTQPMTTPQPPEQQSEPISHLLVIGTAVETTHTFNTPCGEPLGELPPGQVLVIVPRSIVIEAVHTLRERTEPQSQQ